MRRFFLLFFIAFLFFIAPAVPFANKGNDVYAVTPNYVFGDVAGALDAALDQILQDMNAVGHVMSVLTTTYSHITVLVFGLICKLTTLKCDVLPMDIMYKQSLAYQSQVLLTRIYSTPPANTYAFVRDMGQSLGFIPKTAYAQGIGFSGLSPLLPLWKAFRNVAYLLLALFMIVVGFLIMFRKKIDPKTVVTVQNALPNIVVTLLLITFSYAIVGVLIDFMYLVIMVAISILQPISKGAIDTTTAGTFVSGNFGLVFEKMFSGSINAMGSLIGLMGNYAIAAESTTTFIGLLVTVLTGNAGVVVGAVAPPLILFVILAFAFIIAIVRLLFLLISAYIQIILALLISPFQLLLGAFPGSHAFENWMKNLIANISVFPITAIMLLVGTIIIKFDAGGTKLWGPPLLSPAGNNGMAGIIGLGILFAIPSVAGSIKEALKAKPMVAAGPGAILGPVGAGAGQLMNYGYQISMISHYLPSRDKQQGKPA